ncbi:beta-lactamase/transpeptidase-like protein [Saccharata proteae CBS 121410]|uniref:Beta-lactamase/transpeptidase-like protein n=1 Tax=Saccharata proteae CBS 121410 TaxID=1314787 RepID=A0A6A5YEW4_9PEZI|nr:beta-lactamase/transpeptidase-like protein [Saccharata proteae CBS 121410]
MQSLEDTFKRACADREIPQALLIAGNATGTFRYERAFGPRSVRDGADQRPVKLDDIMWIASCTKLLTSIAAMQCVERGQLHLDEPVYGVLPELKSLDVIHGPDEHGKPVLKKHKNPITLRILLTHSSGLAYGDVHPLILQWREENGIVPDGTILGRYLHPLVFEPGTQWIYGPNIDWVGKMIERVDGNAPLQDYMEKNIWQPLGIKDMTFFLDRRPDLEARMVDLSKRDPENGKVKRSNARMPYAGVTEAMGGQGLFSSASEFAKVLFSLLANDEKLLQRSTVADMVKPHLSKGSRDSLMRTLEDEDTNNAMGGLPKTAKKDWGLAGLLCVDDIPGFRAGTTLWGGLPNLSWWIDHQSGLCGLYASQLIPPGDSTTVKYTGIFQNAIHERFAAKL